MRMVPRFWTLLRMALACANATRANPPTSTVATPNAKPPVMNLRRSVMAGSLLCCCLLIDAAADRRWRASCPTEMAAAYASMSEVPIPLQALRLPRDRIWDARGLPPKSVHGGYRGATEDRSRSSVEARKYAFPGP